MRSFQLNTLTRNRTTQSVMTESTMPEGWSFLDLAPELRLGIYDAILHANIDLPWLSNSLHPIAQSKETFRITWCNMMLVCRQVSVELWDHMTDTAAKGSKYNTWVLRLPHDHEATFPAQMSLPCPPWRLKTLHIKMPHLSGIGHSRRAPHTLDQLLSLLVRFGPRLNREKKLPETLCFEELIIAFPTAAPMTGISDQYHLEETVVLAFRRLQEGLSMSDHPLRGAFQKVTLVTRTYEQSWSMAMELEED